MTQDRVRVLRVLEYEGPRDWIEEALASRAVKGTRSFGAISGPCVIREATIGEVPVISNSDVEAEEGLCEPIKTQTEVEAAVKASERPPEFDANGMLVGRSDQGAAEVEAANALVKAFIARKCAEEDRR